MRRAHKKTPVKARQTKTHDKAPVSEHLRELRQRLLIIAAVIIAGGTAAYFVQEHIVNLLLAPSHNQQFIYTNPFGGVGFLFSLSTYVGIIVAIPVIVWQFLAFLSPLMGQATRRVISRYAIWSGLLAAIGIVFGYYIGLPAALHFLGHQFTNKQIQPLFTIQEYLSFVSIYLLGSALLCQIPLFIVIFNGIKPIPPKSLLNAERYVIVFAFIASMLMVPTVNVMNQLVIAVPIIFMYQVAIGLVWFSNRQNRKPKWLLELLQEDQIIQAERERQARESIPLNTY